MLTMMSSPRLSSPLLAAGLVAAALLVTSAAPALAQEKVSPKVGTPLKAALDASAKGQTQQALAKLKEADGISGKTAFEQQKINEAYCAVYVRARNYGAAGPACEKALGKSPTAEQYQTLAQVYFQPGAGRDLKKSIDYANRYLQASGGRDPGAHFLIGQAQHASGNYKAAAASFATAIKNAGARPNENWLRYLQDSYMKLGDTASAGKVTMELVRLYPSADNWRILTSNLARQVAADDQAMFNLYMLMYELNLIDRAATYQEAAIKAIQAGVPGAAVKLLEQGYKTNALASGDPARAKRISDDANKRAAEQKAAMARLDQQAAAGDAAANVRVGEAWLSFGEPDKAIAAANRAIAKGGADTDQAYLLLGRAHAAKKETAEARKAFDQVKHPNYAQIAKLWSIRVGQG
jgi:tetratricopeptide (TPR) repeat protein